MWLILTFVLIISMIGMTTYAGNVAPSGAHYNLNIIGVSNPKTADMTDSSGHVIFVPLNGKAKIELMEAPEGESFQVLDANGTDGPAVFQLPAPGLDPYILSALDPSSIDINTDYSVFVRPLGKPGGWTTITTCAELKEAEFVEFLSKQGLSLVSMMDDNSIVSIEQVGQDITLRTKGKSSFTNVTAELLTILFEVNVTDGNTEFTEYVSVPIFSDFIQGEYWDYDNQGLKLLQVRFYPIGTEVTTNELLTD